MTHSKIYQGMLNNNAEFFRDGDDLMVISNGSIKPFEQISFPHYQLFLEEINSDPQLKSELQKMHPNSEFNQVKQMAGCRFGGIDFDADIKGNTLSRGDYWDCPKRGSCSGEGIICSQVKYNGSILSKRHIDLIKLLVTNATNQTIALTLSIPEGTMHLLKKELYAIFNVQTKQELALKAHHINLI